MDNLLEMIFFYRFMKGKKVLFILINILLRLFEEECTEGKKG